MMKRWQKLHESMFGTHHYIPWKSNVSLSKLGKGGNLILDTCNQAWKLISLLLEEVTVIGKEKVHLNREDKADMIVLQTDCHHHLHHVWIGVVNN